MKARDVAEALDLSPNYLARLFRREAASAARDYADLIDTNAEQDVHLEAIRDLLFLSYEFKAEDDVAEAERAFHEEMKGGGSGAKEATTTMTATATAGDQPTEVGGQ